ncbi:MAG: ribosome recycling factor [Candidatus Pacebacteria bacterium CG_4_10_14_3_um_filter_34_15]|nr:ribosome recycling factor [Candidatus Pacearchaeota archaeon]NCQ65616.1 ribosome recycling factor [Candidatus Paceibacterota bacterium]OIO44911.1 MAG: ribosome recycling factor [Candidatus Pacebacteria bacterium CG1_02_43_31]PIQ80540.1 MAG: ribosome recycling factor [Candidatus Pacebacteria bacterium CG11_big_fil_rev_8_21_14_0_20_34_55]PIX81586.1 MAG: ribosome recycling factor [Candidatus Pacebacteria bacterium CG_4_10_14_3_um_filter_34_15]PJC44175.1 MAG: ribosome recycling factor [Candidat
MSFDFIEFKSKLSKSYDFVLNDIASLRTGRATVQILDPVIVEAYGSKMRLVEVASIQTPDPTMLLVTPWDRSLLPNIEKAISSAELNLNPVVDGDIIRIKIASLTEEKRFEMVKILHKKIESGRVMFRNLRSDTKREIEKQKGNDGISEDDIKNEVKELDDLLKQHMEKLDTLTVNKEKELLTI